MPLITIKVNKNGPYLIQGEDMANVVLVDHEGNRIAPNPKATLLKLCRCGASTTKPFCDGTHSKIGFKGAEEAQREFDKEHK